jgi:hypothetical protein
MLPFVALFALVTLAACANSAAQLPPAPVQAPACLPLKLYSDSEQKALAAQLKTIPADSPLALATRDYLAMRDADRACLAAK